jgi:hypothetical protein
MTRRRRVGSSRPKSPQSRRALPVEACRADNEAPPLGRASLWSRLLRPRTRPIYGGSQTSGRLRRRSDLSTTAAIYGHYDLSDLERAMDALARARREREEPAD